MVDSLMISSLKGESWRVPVLWLRAFRPAATRSLLGLLVALGTILPGLAAQTPAEAAGPDEAAEDVALAEEAVAAKAPAPPSIVTPLRTTGGQLSVQVLVNGEGPYLFTLDSGSGMNVCLDAELAETLGLPTVGEVMNGDGSGTVVPRALAGIDSFVLGGHEFGAQQALVADYRFVSGTGPDRVMGILGLSLFDGGVVTLDAAGEQLRWPDAALELGEHTVRYTAPRGIPEIEVRVGERSWRCTVDTGFSGFFALPDRVRSVLELTGEAQVVGTSRGPNGVGSKVWGAQLAESLLFAGHEIPTPEVYFMEGRSHAYLGGRLLRRYVLSFDTRARLLALRES